MCLLFESALGASFQEPESDFMKTYENYYGITKEKTPENSMPSAGCIMTI